MTGTVDTWKPTETSQALGVYVRGATAEELERGHAAALAFFAKNNCTAEQAAEGAFAYEGMMMGEGGVTKEEERLAEIWEQARSVAAAAICQGWANPAPLASFGLGYTVQQLAEFSDGNWENDPHSPT